MKYYLIPATMAEQLNVIAFRQGNASVGYIVTSGDLAVIGLDAAIEAGAKEITRSEAFQLTSKIKYS